MTKYKPKPKPRPEGWWMQYYQVDVHMSQGFGGQTRHLLIRKRSGLDRITWDTLQAIKDSVLGADITAIEVYPPAADLVYDINARHLWEVPTGFMGIPTL